MIDQQGRAGLNRRFAVAAAVAAASLALAGCSAGQHAQTVSQKGAVDGVAADATSGKIGIRFAGVSMPSNGKSWASGSSAPLQLVFTNNGSTDETLDSVVSPNAVSTAISGDASKLSETPIVVPAGRATYVGFDDKGAQIILKGLTSTLFPSQSVQTTFVFKSGAQIHATLAVKLTEGEKVAPTLETKPTAAAE